MPTSQKQSGRARKTRGVLINLRARQSQRDLIDRAAEIAGKNRSDFMLDSACRAAEDVLLDQTFFHLDEKGFREFRDLLDAKPSATPALRTLMQTKSPWD